MSSLAYAFQMAEWRIERANHHIDDLKRIVDYITSPGNYILSPGKDVESGNYVVRVGPANGGLPHDLPVAMGEAVHNLSVALDYIWSGIFRHLDPSQAERDRRETFPKHESRAQLVQHLSRSPVIKVAPKLRDFILEEIRPYKDGNYLLWVGSKLNNIDKHRLLMSCMTIAKFGKFIATSEDGSVIDLSYSAVQTHGPAFKMAFAAPFKLNDDAEVTVDVEFAEPPHILPGQPVLKTIINIRQTTSETVEKFRKFFG